jgi:hypothetical protein
MNCWKTSQVAPGLPQQSQPSNKSRWQQAELLMPKMQCRAYLHTDLAANHPDILMAGQGFGSNCRGAPGNAVSWELAKFDSFEGAAAPGQQERQTNNYYI